ncbi:MAG: STAS domain-containing protein [Anaerolineaceae bacterium]|nr:STAS domain-containing protein [Anaerolineaceae bacterium]
METSMIQKLENLLLVSVPRDLMDNEVLQLRRQVAQRVRQHHSRWVLLDFAQVDICDSFFGRFIQSMAHMTALMGAEVIVSGLQDAVVETLVDLGMTLPSIHAVLDLDDAVELSRQADEDSLDHWLHAPGTQAQVAEYSDLAPGEGHAIGDGTIPWQLEV